MGAVAHYLEAAGIATTGISLVKEQTEAMRAPRFLWVPFELGRPFGAPNQPDFQRRVLRHALGLLERTDGPSVLDDFPDDAPVDPDGAPWVCPVPLPVPPPATDRASLRQAVTTELGRLAPWADLAPVPTANSGLALVDMVDLVAAAAGGDDITDAVGLASPIEALRLLADDLRSWYLHAVAQQPGQATGQERNDWFWRETALARLLGRLAHRLLDDPDPALRGWATRGLIPRDHWSLLVPEGAGDDSTSSPADPG